MVLSESVRRVLTAGHTAHLVTLNPDGSPQVSLVWVGLDGEEVVCAHLGAWKKVSNIQQDARVALSLETGEKTGGVVDYVVLSGRARITEGGAPELLQQLARVYLGPGIKYPPSDHAPAGYITHIQIEQRTAMVFFLASNLILSSRKQGRRLRSGCAPASQPPPLFSA